MKGPKHIVVIGSGAGGLCAASYCAYWGASVTVLEQAAQTGGFINPFKRKGYHFDPGVHYIGDLQPGQLVYRVFEDLGLDPSSLFCELDPTGFDHYRFPDFEFRFGRGLDNFKENLLLSFPEEKLGIEAYFKLANRLSKGTEGVYDFLHGIPKISRWTSMLSALPNFTRINRETYGSLLDRMFTGSRIKSVLAANGGNYGLPPSKVPALLGLGMWLHFASGAFFPRGGSGGMKNALENVITENGGQLLTRKEVTNIVLKGKQVVAVKTADGDEIEADAIISAIEPKHTFGRLIGPEHLSPRLTKKLDKLRSSLSSFCVFLGMRRDLREYGFGNFNIWSYPNQDPELFNTISDTKSSPREQALILSPNSLKDDSGKMVPDKGCSTLEVISLTPFEPWEKWDKMRSYKRGEEYEARKKAMGKSLIEAIEERFPDVIGDVEVEEFATPVTNSYYVNTVAGGIYGPEMAPDQMGPSRFLPVTPFKGLYLAGSGTFGGGIGPCLASGKVAARFALRRWFA